MAFQGLLVGFAMRRKILAFLISVFSHQSSILDLFLRHTTPLRNRDPSDVCSIAETPNPIDLLDYETCPPAFMNGVAGSPCGGFGVPPKEATIYAML